MRKTLSILVLLSLTLSASADYLITMKTTFVDPAAASMTVTNTTKTKNKRQLTIDTTEMPGGFKTTAYSLMMCDTEQQADFDPELKIYNLRSLRPSFLPPADPTKKSTTQSGTGKIISNFVVEDKGIEKVGQTDARHWIVDSKMVGSGCAGDFKYDVRREFWSAPLPTFVCPLLTSWGDQTVDQCRITMERGGDVAKFDESQNGQVVKEILYQNGKPVMTREMSEYSTAELAPEEFTLDGYREVTREEFDQALQAKMMKMYSR